MTMDDGTEEHPAAFVTVKVYEPALIPTMVTEVPVPEAATPPGVLVMVHEPVPGKSFKTTLPVDTAQVGCVINPTVGATGKPAIVLITILEDEAEVHPEAFVTVKVYVPGISPVTVVLVPVLEVVISPGFLVNVQVPVAGKPLKTTLPVGAVHVGCVIVPGMGAEGIELTVAVTGDLVEVVQPFAVAST